MQVMAEFDPKWIGECCRQAGISEDDITTHALAEKLTQPLSKGVIYELNRFRKNNGYTWSDFYDWVKQLYGNDETLPTLGSVKVAISRLEKKCSELSRNKHSDQIEALFLEPFISSSKQVMASQGVTTNTASCSREVLEHVNVELARELKSAEEALVAECCKTEELAEKLSKLSVRNTNKKLKRRQKNRRLQVTNFNAA